MQLWIHGTKIKIRKGSQTILIPDVPTTSLTQATLDTCSHLCSEPCTILVGIGACTDLLFLVPLHSPWSLVNLCLFLLASLCYPLTLLLFHILLFLFFSSTCCIASSLKPLEHNHTGVKVASGDLDLSSPGHVCEHSAGMWAQIYKHQDWISAVPNVEQQTSCLRFGFALMPVMLPCSAPRPYVIVQFTAICNIFRYPLLGI